MSKNKIYDLIILGAGCTGLTAGLYAGRARLSTLIIEKHQVGGQAATTNEIANYPGFENITGPELMDKMLKQAQAFGAEIIYEQVESVDFKSDIKVIKTANQAYQAYSVIIATGANPKHLGFKGEEEFTGRGVGYCATCDGFFFSEKDIFVIGGGYSAAEEALYLTRFGKKVTIIVRKNEFRCAQSLVDRVMEHPKIEVRFNTELLEVSGDQIMQRAVFKDNKTNKIWEYNVSSEDKSFGIFIFIGYKPTTELFKNQILVDNEGYILTNDQLETNIAGVFAAGDLRPKLLRQLVTATSDGAIAAVCAEKYIHNYKESHDIINKPTKLDINNANAQSLKKSQLFSNEIQNQLNSIFEKFTNDITLVTIKDSNIPSSLELEGFLKEISEFSDKINLISIPVGSNVYIEKKIKFDKLPVLALLDSSDEYTGVKFLGIPGGHEFNSLISALKSLGVSSNEIDTSLLSRIKNLKKAQKIQIVISLSCHFCPETVISAQKIALLNNKIEAEMIDIALFPRIKETYNIMSVPAMIINQKDVVFGAKSIENILEILERNELE